MNFYRKWLLVSTALCCFIFLLSRCIGTEQRPDPRGQLYAGAGSCRQCHQAVYDSFGNTAHANATAIADSTHILGHFSGKKNVFNYQDNTSIVMEHRDSGYYQVLYQDGVERGAYRFDILFGSRHAQTSLYWRNDRLYELPLSHYAATDGWATSPGFSHDHPVFQRLVDADCFDCHSSNISIKSQPINNDPTFEKGSVIFGIDCERCHGPAMNHVNFHQQNPGLKEAAWLVKNKSLTQQQKLDACAVCHSGNDQMKIQSRFQFKMGDTLGYFFMPFGGGQLKADVHGNQYSLMLQSRCFKLNTMNCGTCHDPHTNAVKDLAFYSQKCMSCHAIGSDQFCPKYASMGDTIKKNCIDCHMPYKASEAIQYQLQQEKEKQLYLLRTHKIAIYRDSVDQFNLEKN